MRTVSKKKRTRPSQPAKSVRHILLATAVIAPLAAAPEALAQGQPLDDIAFSEQPRKLNRFGISGRFGFNIRAEFRTRGTIGFQNNPGPGPAGGSGFDHFYDDGYVRPDDTFPPASGLTKFWGYDYASQVMGNQIQFHSAEFTSSEFFDREGSDNVPFGLELTYARELGANETGSWGFEGAFGFTHLNIRQQTPLSGNINLVTDTYMHSLTTVPPPGHRGTFSGGNQPVISDTPTTRITEPATIRGTRNLRTDVFGFRLGPYFSFPMSDRTSFQMGGGFAAAIIESDFRFNEEVDTITQSVVFTGTDNKVDFLVGGYAMAQFITQLSEKVNVFGGVQFQSLGNFRQSAGNKDVRIDFSQAFFVHGGVGFSF